jgi:hypothetical protein
MNREQEFFMNCAVVTITGGSGSAPAVAGSSASSPAASVKAASVATASAVPASSPSVVLDTPNPVVSDVSAAVSVAPAPVNAAESTSSAAATTTSSSGSGRHCRKRNGRKCHHNSKRDHPLLDATMKYKRTPGAKGQRFVQRAAAVAFTSRPIMLFADVNNGCLSPKTTAELKYPNPGPDVVEGDGEYPLQLPTGTCG